LFYLIEKNVSGFAIGYLDGVNYYLYSDVAIFNKKILKNVESDIEKEADSKASFL